MNHVDCFKGSIKPFAEASGFIALNNGVTGSGARAKQKRESGPAPDSRFPLYKTEESP